MVRSISASRIRPCAAAGRMLAATSGVARTAATAAARRDRDLNTDSSPEFQTLSKTSALWRQWGAIAGVAAVLAGCEDVAHWVPINTDPSFPGGVAGDEPRAVMIGR